MSLGAGPFQKIDSKEAAQLLRAIHEFQVPVFFKFPESLVYRCQAEPKAWGKAIICERPANLPAAPKDRVITGNVLLHDEIFFFQAKVKLDRKTVTLHLTSDFFQLARRRIKRLRVPAWVELAFVSRKVGGKLVFLRGAVQDISLRGLKVGLLSATPAIRFHEEIEGHLRYGNMKPIEFSGKVRHRRFQRTSKYEQLIGLEMPDPSPAEKMRIEQLILEIQREVFSKTLGSPRGRV